MLSNYNHLSPEPGIASPTSAFPSLPSLPPSIFDQPVDGGLFHRGNGSPKVSCHVSTGVNPEEDKTADIGLNAAAKPPRQNSPNGNQAASCHVGTDVNPEEDKAEASGVKAPAKPPRGMPPIRPGNSGLRFASSDFDLDFAKVSMTSPTESVEGERFLPVFRSGSCADTGPKSYMEDEHLCIDNLSQHLNAPPPDFPAPSSFYGVFDGHGGTDAACFVKGNLLKFIVEDNHFPNNIGKALKNAFINADYTLHDSNSLDKSSGTTVLTAIFFGRSLTIANAGDCRAVLGKRGRAVELTKDHKPNNKTEKLRIEKLGGTIFDGYLNGQLSVSRALGDWHLKGTKGSLYPLSAEPELHELVINAEDEFLIIGCDGLWDVMSSQCAVTMVRKELMAHNDPEVCCKELVKEAINRNSCDNLTVLVVCFSPDPPPKIEVPRWRVRKSISMEGLHQIRGALAANES